MTTATIETPHVYKALAAILASLSVAKGGTLPSNMGGKPYITAVDAAAETKRKFVENNLIFVPNETVFKHETIIHKDRISVAIVITGQYTIISTQDGSHVTVSGTGDGLANGTAVASNIASTNALKNALLRTFLITEQSVEDAAKNGPDSEATPTERKLTQARSAAPAKPRTATTSKARDTIRVEYIEAGIVSKDIANSMLEAAKAAGLSGDAAWDKVLERLKKGEVE